MTSQLTELNRFIGKAAAATYAGDGQEVEAQRLGFNELEFKEGDWEYRDSYTGFFRSWGEEVVWLKGVPFWTQLYGGGMVEEFHGDKEFAIDTFNFLKKAMSAGEKQENFQPRGLNNFKDGDWEYLCSVDGDISSYKGSEKILLSPLPRPKVRGFGLGVSYLSL